MTHELTKKISLTPDQKELSEIPGVENMKFTSSWADGKLVGLRGLRRVQKSYVVKETPYSISTITDPKTGTKTTKTSYKHPVTQFIDSDLDPALVAFAKSKGLEA